MRRGWLRPAAWTVATGAMIGMSWYGVQSVLARPGGADVKTAVGTPYLAPSADPSAYASSSAPAPSAATGQVSASARPSASATSGILPPSATASPYTVAPPLTSPSGVPSSPTATASPRTGDRTYSVDGGSVVLDLGPSSATLVSEKPYPGWTARTWRQDDWLRVDFTAGQRTSTVLCSWNGHAPTVQTYND